MVRDWVVFLAFAIVATAITLAPVLWVLFELGGKFAGIGALTGH